MVAFNPSIPSFVLLTLQPIFATLKPRKDHTLPLKRPVTFGMFSSDLSLFSSSLSLTEHPLWLKIVQTKMAFNNTDQLKSFQLIECLKQAVLDASNSPSPWQRPVDSARQRTVVGPCPAFSLAHVQAPIQALICRVTDDQ